MPKNSKKHRVTVILDDDEMARFEAYCTENGFKKSTLLAKLLKDYLDLQTKDNLPSQLGLWR